MISYHSSSKRQGLVAIEKSQVIAKAIPILDSEPRVIAGYLFGSLARGTESPMSDIDIAVLSSRGDTKSIVDLTQRLTQSLSEALDSLVVDLVCLNGADLALRYNVILEGVLFYERDPIKRVRFEKRTIVEYFDMVPLWDVYDHYMFLRMSGAGEEKRR